MGLRRLPVAASYQLQCVVVYVKEGLQCVYYPSSVVFSLSHLSASLRLPRGFFSAFGRER